MKSKEALERLIGNKVFISLGRTQGKKQFVNVINIIQKDLEILEEHRKIEKELGIDVITLFKALKNGFYTKSNNGIKFWKEDDKHFVYVRDLKYDIEICCEECENAIGAVPTMFLERSTKDYGKTWALTKEELENE